MVETNNGTVMNKMKNIADFLDSEEGKKSMDEYFKKLQREEEHLHRWVEKFKSRYENNLDEIIEKLLNKYDSDEYVKREYSLGYQPRESLLWLVWEYARLNCEECLDEKYFNSFTGDAFYIGSYVIQIMHGQGSVLKIEKRND